MLTPQNLRIVAVALFVMATGNYSLFQHILQVYPPSLESFPFLLSLTVFFTGTTALFFLLICHGRLGNWLLALFLLLCSQAAYYMDQYGVVIDAVMMDNIFQTNVQEFIGLVSPGLVFRTVLLGLLPAWLVIKYKPASLGWAVEIKSRLKIIVALLLLLLAVVMPFTANYASFIRQHKMVRFYANPVYFSYSAVNYLKPFFKSSEKKTLKKTAEDTVAFNHETKNELIILVVGETARADRFSLNGYSRETNPELRKEAIVSLGNVASCGTSTGVSLPCMFSVLGRQNFDHEAAQSQENILDVLSKNGVQILWRDNNSDSKGVAARMRYEDFKDPALNPVCDDECRDIGMLSGLEKYIGSNPGRDILVVMHQMGNHGPEYYKRYPAEFERFKPVCKSSELSSCTKEEIDNAYDNAILYTDFFLSSVINFLKKYDDQYETAMLYVSDHGESLGEHGLYLHAAPYILAPKEQTHIPAIVWMGEHFDYRLEQLEPYRDYPLSHDDLFCMLLVAFELSSKVCESKAPILIENVNLKNTQLRKH